MEIPYVSLQEASPTEAHLIDKQPPTGFPNKNSRRLMPMILDSDFREEIHRLLAHARLAP